MSLRQLKGMIIKGVFCLFLCVLAKPALAMPAFDSVPVEHPVFARYKALLGTALSKKLFQPSPSKTRDRYTMAVHLAQLHHSADFQKGTLTPETLHLMQALSQDLASELRLLGKDPEEMLLELSSLENNFQNLKFPGRPRKMGKVKLESIEIEGTLRPQSQETYLKSLLNLTYADLHQLDGYLKVSAKGEISPARISQTEAEIDVYEALLDWRPRRILNQVKAGKYRRHLGLGLLGNPNFQGLELIKQHQDYVLDIGVSHGFFASVESPFVLDIPLTVYSLSQTETGETKSLHSGLFLKKRWKNWGFSTEFVESRHRLGVNPGDSSSFAWLLEYHPRRNWSLKTSLTHTGDGFSAPDRSGWSPDQWTGISLSIQEEVLHSLSNYFGERLSSTPGFSDMKISLGLFGTGKNSFEIHYDRLYDHSSTRVNTRNGLQLATLSLSRQLRKDTSVLLRFQNLTWDAPGTSRNGFFGGKDRQDFNLIQSRIQVEF
jgi:hypothetical protein